MLSEEAMLEALKVAEGLDMYGLEYFEVENSKGKQVYLATGPDGVGGYTLDDRFSPKVAFSWDEISKVSYTGKMVEVVLCCDLISVYLH